MKITSTASLLFLAISFNVFAQEVEEKPKFELVQLSRTVNSPYHDSAPVVSPDGKTLYFTINDHPENNKGISGSQDIWYSELGSNGQWTQAKHFPAPLNTNKFNQVLSVSLDGDRLLVRGGGGKDELGFSICRRVNGVWQKPRGLNIPGFKGMCQGMFNGAFLSYDDKVLLLYFSEQKGAKFSDLYVSYNKGNNNWTRPEPIKALNTRLDEFGPYIAPDNKTLYFASNKPGGLGNADIYKTVRLDETWQKWSEPENIGAPINTGGFDAYYTVGLSDTLVFTTRAYMSRDGGHLDIFTLQRIIEKKPKVFLAGAVFNGKTKEPIKANVRYEVDGEVLGAVKSDAQYGGFNAEVQKNGNFIFNVNAEGFLAAVDSVEVPRVKADTTIYKEFYLKPIEVGLSVRLNNIFFDFDKTTLRPESFPELDKVVELLEQNPKIRIEIGGHTDSKGSDDYNKKLSQGRAESVVAYLVSKWIEPERVTAKGYGESQPEVPNDSDENMQINRRVVFTVLSNE